MKKINIAIDGVAGSGKGITAQLVAQKLGYKHIDTGAMYRAFAWYLSNNKIPLDKKAILTSLSDCFLHFDNQQHIHVNNKDINDQIRTPYISGLIKHFVHIPGVRQWMVHQQQHMGADGGVVMEGRDIGSVVLPHAAVKIFLTADLPIRAQRRLADQKKKHPHLTLQDIIKNLEQRDHADWVQLQLLFDRYGDKVTTIDTTHCSIQEQVDKIIQLAKKYL